MRCPIIFTLFFAAVNAHATVTISDVAGASNYTNTGTTTGTGTGSTSNPIIYAGTAGTAASCANNRDAYTCNNCNAGSGPLGTICNEKRIMPGGVLRVGMRTTVGGWPALYDTTTNSRVANPSSPTSPTVANSTGYLEIPWQNVCSTMTPQIGTSTVNCEFAGTKTFNVGFDKLNNATKDSDDDTTQVTIYVSNVVGASDVSILSVISAPQTDALYPITLQKGDEKIYISTFSPGATFPNSTFLKFAQYVLYLSPANIADIGSVDIAEFNIFGTSNSDVSLSPDNVDGLTNGTPYYVVGAHKDDAGNIGYFDLTYNGGAGITPDFVFGLLSQDFECFVATATYGTADAREVKTLRMFRNYLIEHHQTWAQPLIKFYYKHSPKLANFIRDSEILKSVSRIILWGPIQFAKISLKHGMGYAMMIFWLPLILLIAVYRWWNVKVARRT